MKNPGVWAGVALSLLLHGTFVVVLGTMTEFFPRSAGAPGKEILTVMVGSPREMPIPPPSTARPRPQTEAPTTGTPPEKSLEEPGFSQADQPVGGEPEIALPAPLNSGIDLNLRLPPDFRPEYPLLARKRHWEGTARFQLELDKEGKLVLLELLESSGYALLDDAGRKALTNTEFLPGSPAQGTVVIVFKLE